MGTLLPHSTTAIYCLTHSIVLLYCAHMWSYIVSIFSIYFLSLLSHSLYSLTLMYPSIVSLYPQSITSIYCLTHYSNKIAKWLDSNRGSLVSEATALPTAPQPLLWFRPILSVYSFSLSLFLFSWSQRQKVFHLRKKHTPPNKKELEQKLSWTTQGNLGGLPVL